MNMYADDICLLAETHDDLQKMLHALELYCSTNKLEVNVAKTKIMIFHYGRCPPFMFTFEGQQIEIVKHFVYLGFTFTTQLTFTPHLLTQISKARSRIGQLFARLPLMNLPLETLLRVFEMFATPIFLYGLPLWISNCSIGSRKSLDALFTKFVKRYLGLRPWANNAIVHYITGTMPFSIYLQLKSSNMTGSFVFPNCLSGLKLSFLEHSQIENYWPIPQIPSTFWLSKMFSVIPSAPFYRKKLIAEIFDLQHTDLCQTTTFHPHARDDCLCKFCGELAHMYHYRYCVCTSH